MNNLKCWFAGSKHPIDHPYVEAVFAHSHKEAKRIAWREGYLVNDECGGDFLDLNIKRFEEFDYLASGDEAYLVKDDKTLHRMGWREDGAEQCDSCGLYEWDGLLTVCPDCQQCNECGCCCDELETN